MIESANVAIGSRLRQFREYKRMSQAQMAQAVDGATAGLQKNELGIAMPNSKVLIGLYRLGLNINWLLSGEGSMLFADAAGKENDNETDLHAYGECLEILELALNKFKRQLTPEKKRAAVDAMYRAYLRDKQVDKQLLDMITQFAA